MVYKICMYTGEPTMVHDGAMIALVRLISIKGQKLLPICVQAMYNLTCSESYFKGIERVYKALLNIPINTSAY